MTRITMGEGKF